MNIKEKVVAVDARRVLRTERVEKERKSAAAARLKKEQELNEMWAGVADYFACDGTCPTCLLGKEKFRGKHQRKEEE